jgi:uncharacterized protein
MAILWLASMDESGAPQTPGWTLADAAVVGLLMLGLLLSGVIAQLMLQTAAPQLAAELSIPLTAYERSQLSMLVVLTVVAGLAAAIIAAVARRRGITDLPRSISWNPQAHMKAAALAGLLLAAAITPILLRVWGTPAKSDDEFKPLGAVLYCATTVLLQPIIEEIYFRGILFVALLRRTGAIGAVVLTALIFALLHPLHRLTILPVAFVLSLTRLKTRSVAACVAMHAAYNLGVLLFKVPFLH